MSLNLPIWNKSTKRRKKSRYENFALINPTKEYTIVEAKNLERNTWPR